MMLLGASWKQGQLFQQLPTLRWKEFYCRWRKRKRVIALDFLLTKVFVAVCFHSKFFLIIIVVLRTPCSANTKKTKEIMRKPICGSAGAPACNPFPIWNPVSLFQAQCVLVCKVHLLPSVSVQQRISLNESVGCPANNFTKRWNQDFSSCCALYGILASLHEI